MKKHNNTDLMIDIESFSEKKDKIILSLGAVFFDIRTGEKSHSFLRHINIDMSLRDNYSIDGKTLKWWMGQDQKLLKKLIKNDQYSSDPHDTMIDFIEFCDYGTSKFMVWSRPPLYDLRALLDAFEKYDLDYPWDFRNIRCVRTYASLFPGIENDFPAKEQKHDPMVDCMRQIEYVSEIYKRIENMKEHCY